jgi:hypothetical protein
MIAHMNGRLPLKTRALAACFVLTSFAAQGAVFDEHDTSRLASINEALQSFENDVGSALHDLSSDDTEQIESYAYVELNLEAAHERLNNVFMRSQSASIWSRCPIRLLFWTCFTGRYCRVAKTT